MFAISWRVCALINVKQELFNSLSALDLHLQNHAVYYFSLNLAMNKTI